MTPSRASTADGDRPREPPAPLRSREARDFETVFVVGCPRSGTTWLQLLLAEHPDVVTAPETQIFAYYLEQLREQWRREHEGPVADGQGGAGLSRLLSERDFDDLCRSVAGDILDTIAARDPDAATVVEKSPQHALHVEWIHRLFPTARIVHVIRDPRDVASSLMAAGRSWGGGWAPKGPVDAARMWIRNVKSGLRGRSLADVYSEVRYEDLKEDAVESISRVYQRLDLAADRQLCEAAVEACRLERLEKKVNDGGDMPVPGRKSPDGFFRKGEAGGWRDDLSAGQANVVEYICSDLMEELGYERTGHARFRPAVRVLLRDGLERLSDALAWQVGRVARRV